MSGAGFDEIVARPGGAQPGVEGAILRPLTTHRDPRGSLTELLRAEWTEVFGPEMPFTMVYTSTTMPGVARDVDRWHVHQHQIDRFVCLAGAICVAIADVRPGSATAGRLALVELRAGADAPAGAMLTVPAGTLHGFVVLGDQPATILNFPNRTYDPADEGRVPFVDAGVTFPDGTPFAWERVLAGLGGR
jgi:dTDP-4-dehydrorhamnose 3,5-epimerase